MNGRLLIVVSDLQDLPELRHRVTLADQYLSSGGGHRRGATVINLCRSHRYRSKGYYVSLVADARGHRVLPALATLEELSEPYGVFRVLRESGIPTLDVGDQRSWRSAVASPGDVADVLVVLGRASDPRFEAAAGAAFRAWPIPLLRLEFVRKGQEWWVAGAEPVPLKRLDGAQRSRLVETLLHDAKKAIARPPPPLAAKRASIAVLWNAGDRFSPSSVETLDHLERVASAGNIHVHRLGLDELDQLPEYDALFIRTLTGVREPSFQFALRAEMLDMPVIDDPQSIIRCSNKVFIEELLRREGIPTPRTLIVSPRTSWREITSLGTPVVVKLPDGSFSAAVHKVGDEIEYRTMSVELFRRSPLLIAQEFLPTEYDWRVTVLDGRVLFVARYYMAEGHWQIRSSEGAGDRYGKVEAVPRENAPKEIVALAVKAARLIGIGLYGVDLKETPAGPVVIEINDNPNIDRGHDDAADGDTIYRDILDCFVRWIEARPVERKLVGNATRSSSRPYYRPFAVAGMELEYAVVDENMDAASLVEQAFRVIEGRATSAIDIADIGFSNEIADHVFEVKTLQPVRCLAAAEESLVQGIRRFSAVLRQEFGARLLPTGMHPWMDPRTARLWRRSGRKIYQAYAQIFDVHSHGWMNVHAAHLNLPMGRGPEAVAMYNATILVIPYLPALAASSPMFDGRLQDSVDNRMEWILRHQIEVPESQGEILPEPISSITDYRRRILQPMYDALETREGAELLKRDFLNARGAVLKFARRALEVRVLDMQECVKLDVAIAVFVRSVLRYYAQQLTAGRMSMPPRRILLDDFRATIRCGSRAQVVAPQFGDLLDRDPSGRATARDTLRALNRLAQRAVRRDEAHYLELIGRIIETGSLSERIRERLTPFEGDPDSLRVETKSVYGELSECLVENVPWPGRW